MLLRFALFATMLLAGADTAFACLASPETIHNREIALIYTGLKKVSLKADDLAAVKKLEALAERLHRARNFEQAQKARHAALTKMGYRYEPAAPDVSAPQPQGVPHGGENPRAVAPSIQATTKGCGGDGGKWVAPIS